MKRVSALLCLLFLAAHVAAFGRPAPTPRPAAHPKKPVGNKPVVHTELHWLDSQRALHLRTRTRERVVYDLRGNGDRLFGDYRADLTTHKWVVIDTVWADSMRHLRARRGTELLDVTLQNLKSRGVITVSFSTVKTHAAFLDRVVSEDETETTCDCNGGAFAINADSCTLTLTGSISVLRVNGSHNTVRVPAEVAAIVVSGDGNQVHWDTVRNKRPPVVTNVGANNEVEGVKEDR